MLGKFMHSFTKIVVICFGLLGMVDLKSAAAMPAPAPLLKKRKCAEGENRKQENEKGAQNYWAEFGRLPVFENGIRSKTFLISGRSGFFNNGPGHEPQRLSFRAAVKKAESDILFRQNATQSSGIGSRCATRKDLKGAQEEAKKVVREVEKLKRKQEEEDRIDEANLDLEEWEEGVGSLLPIHVRKISFRRADVYMPGTKEKVDLIKFNNKRQKQKKISFVERRFL
jgi:hypothetical protein